MRAMSCSSSARRSARHAAPRMSIGICERSAREPGVHLGADAARERACAQNRAAIDRRSAAARARNFRDCQRIPDRLAPSACSTGTRPARAHGRDARFRVFAIERNDDLVARESALTDQQRAADRPRRVVAIADVEFGAHLSSVNARAKHIVYSAAGCRARYGLGAGGVSPKCRSMMPKISDCRSDDGISSAPGAAREQRHVGSGVVLLRRSSRSSRSPRPSTPPSGVRTRAK